MKISLLISAMALSVLLNTGCTTAMYGQQFERTNRLDEYTFKVFTGGLAHKGTATERAEVECEKFMFLRGYKSYKIVSSDYQPAPPGFVFIVQFTN